MSQGKNKKSLNKMVRKGNKGYPIATIAFYGPTHNIATKVVCAIIEYDGAEAEPMQKWFSASDMRKSEQILGEIIDFVEENRAKSVSMVEGIIGCPHEEGVDYPEGYACPECSYWRGRDRFTGDLLH